MLPFLLGALLIGGAALVVIYWDDIVDWLKKLVNWLRNKFAELKKKVAHAAGAFIQKVENGLAAIRHKLYYQEEGEWIEETTTRKVKESEIPASILRKAKRSEETDVTDEIEDELKLSLN